MSPSRLVMIAKAAVALAGLLLLAWEAHAARRAASSPRAARWRTRLLATLGVAAFAGWWNFGLFHFTGYVHPHEFYHYYLGAKYSQELGYTRLYHCVATADADQGFSSAVAARYVRDLATNTLQPGSVVLANRGYCTDHFSPDRWRQFSADVSVLRVWMHRRKWIEVQADHGYNASPVWTAAGSLLTNLGPASARQFLLLSLIDPALYLVMWAVAWWAFGWRAVCVALLWWGTNYPARFYWTGGAFLRADWLALTVIGIALARRHRPVAAGFSLGWAALLRVFPGVLLLPFAVAEVFRMVRARSPRPSPDAVRLAAGAGLAVVLLVPAASFVTSGRLVDLAAWRGFVENSRKHYESPATNNMGLRVLAAFDPAQRTSALAGQWRDAPWDAWEDARRQTRARRAPVFWGIAGLLALVVCRAVARRPAWQAIAISAALLPLALELTSYYYAVLLVMGFLWPGTRWIGPGLAAASLATCLSAATLSQNDELFAAISAIVVVLAVAVAVFFAISDRPATTPALET